MKIGETGLRMSSGEIRHFRSESARNNFERVAQAYNHGWRPSGSPRVKALRKQTRKFARKHLL